MSLELARRTAAALLLILSTTSTALASISCSATITNLDLGTVDILVGAAVNGTATIQINCTITGLDTLLPVRICPNIGNGTGGRDSSARYMTGAGTLAYQLYTDSARTTVWGDRNQGLSTVPSVNVTAASPNATLTLYGKLFANQQTAPAGSYSSDFNTTHVDFRYGPNVIGLVACDAINLSLLNQSVHPTFSVLATISKFCSLTTTAVDFSSHGVISADLTAYGAVNLTCTSDTDFQIGLGDGQNSVVSGERRMKDGGEYIAYELYRNTAGGPVRWGLGSEVYVGAGTGAEVAIQVVGVVPAQDTPSPGTYQDTVAVTVTY